jgi:diguanylate cyclase (GGDEF)-like protein/PAS domain S-box-containing protein
MDGMAQIGIPAVPLTAGWAGGAAQFVFPLFGGRPVFLHWGAIALLILAFAAGAILAFAAGALLRRIYPRAGIRKRSGESTEAELSMLRAVVANLPDPIYVKDSQSRFLLANQAAANNNAGVGAATGADLIEKSDFDFFPRELAEIFFEDEQNVMHSGLPLVSKEEQIKNSDGRTRCILSTKVPLLDSAGEVIGLIGIGRDITALKETEAELRKTRKELEFKAEHDCLTTLFNRGAILEMLARELNRSVRKKCPTAVLLGDLDHFKDVNDVHGHPIGDEVLREAARRLLGSVRNYDFVGRYGGEEFLVVLPNCATTDALARAEQLRETMAATPISTLCGPISITISIGVLVTQEGGDSTIDDILREVDAALYAAKAAGRNRCRLAVPPLSDRVGV